MKDGKWKIENNLRSAALKAGSFPGIYSIGSRHEVGGLPVKYDHFYIGKSNNLERRFKEHLPRIEKNSKLRHWLIENRNRYVVLFAYFDEKDLYRVEKDYIKQLQPKYNILHKNNI